MSGATDGIPGALPAPLPPGEAIVWQGRPDAGRLLTSAFHARKLIVYFGVLALGGLIVGSPVGAVLTLGAGAVCLGVLALIARAASRTSIYTLTDRRLVLRTGMALPMHFNLPLTRIGAADYRDLGGGCGDIALRLEGKGRIAWALLWPHVRPWRLSNPEPMLRAVPEAAMVARLLHRCCAALVEVEVAVPAEPARPAAARSRRPASARRRRIEVTA